MVKCIPNGLPLKDGSCVSCAGVIWWSYREHFSREKSHFTICTALIHFLPLYTFVGCNGWWLKEDRPLLMQTPWMLLTSRETQLNSHPLASEKVEANMDRFHQSWIRRGLKEGAAGVFPATPHHHI